MHEVPTFYILMGYNAQKQQLPACIDLNPAFET